MNKFGWMGALIAAAVLLSSCISEPSVQRMGDGVALRSGTNRIEAEAGTYTIWFVRECGRGAPDKTDLAIEVDAPAVVLDVKHPIGTAIQGYGCVRTLGALRLESRATVEIKIRWINEPDSEGYLLMVEGNEGSAR